MTVLVTNRLLEWEGVFKQTLLVLLMNVPTVSFGLSLAWVSLASGTNSVEPQGAVVGGAGATHAASIIGVILSAVALRTGRKPPLIASSAAFALCWGLKINGGYWCILIARIAAGLAGAAAWTAAPLMGREISSGAVQGAAAAAPVLAHNFGFLLMYAAAYADIPHKVILWCCLSISLFHCLAFLLVPESPPFLAASGKIKEARASLAWLRGTSADNPELTREVETLPPPDDATESPFAHVKELCNNPQRRRALILSVIAVAGQECCGLLALLQFAEQVFAEASGDAASPARNALILGAVQLLASGVALYLVERVGRRPLIVWTAVACAGFLAAGTALSWVGASAAWLAVVLAGAVAVDSLGMQPAPYALLADMFHYRYRSCALLISTGAAAAGNALEVALFGAAATAGMHAALGLAAGLTTAYALFAIFALPETRNKTPEEIYEIICPAKKSDAENPDVKNGYKNNKLIEKDLNKSREDFYNAIYDNEKTGEMQLKKISLVEPPEMFVTCEAKMNKNQDAKNNVREDANNQTNGDYSEKNINVDFDKRNSANESDDKMKVSDNLDKTNGVESEMDNIAMSEVESVNVANDKISKKNAETQRTSL